MTRDLLGQRPPRARLDSSATAGLLILANVVIACAPANTAPPPGAPAWTSQPDPAPARMDGDGPQVLVSRGAYWTPARVIARTAEGFVVSYETNGPESIETVSLDRIRPLEAAPPPGAAAPAPSFQVGEQVLVAAPSRKLFLAEVVQQVGPARYRIHYSGFGPEVAEDVGPERLRRQFTGASALAVSQPVWVLTGSQAMLARVVAVLGPASWLVRFDGYGPESDQEVGPERIVLQAPPQAALAGSPAPAPPASPSALTAPGAPSPIMSGAPGASVSPAATTTISETSFTIGQEVLVEHRGVYHRAKVVSVTPSAAVTPPAPALAMERGAASAGAINSTGAAAATVRVRYEPPGPRGEEDIPAARVRAAPAPGGGTPFQPGQAVLMEWRGLFFPAKVVKASGKGQYRLRFEGEGPEADEIVPVRRLRPAGS